MKKLRARIVDKALLEAANVYFVVARQKDGMEYEATPAVLEFIDTETGEAVPVEVTE